MRDRYDEVRVHSIIEIYFSYKNKMTYSSISHSLPRALYFKKAANKANLIIHGQGVILFTASGPCSLTFSDASGVVGLKVSFTESNVLVNLEPSNEPLVDTRNSKGVVSQSGATYWFSLDSQNLRLTAGIGEARIETIIYSFQFPSINKNSCKAFLEGLIIVEVARLQITSMLRDPITRQVPLLVKDIHTLTMDMIDAGTVLPKANLSVMSQKLYDTISGKAFVLDSPDFPQFSKAIEASIRTPGHWCYERLKEKANEFNKDKPDPSETYLRITLGENNGESPGIPYVMEIWPVGHYSPIHNHGGASAVIRVLHGTIQISLFPFLSSDDVSPFAKKEFSKGDITWISPTLNQVHQLKNLESNKNTCITIQCYMYEQEDRVHYDYFDYLDADGLKQQFDPDSDMDFSKFKATMKREWAEQMGCWGFLI